jgi:hypothetical protein
MHQIIFQVIPDPKVEYFSVNIYMLKYYGILIKLKMAISISSAMFSEFLLSAVLLYPKRFVCVSLIVHPFHVIKMICLVIFCSCNTICHVQLFVYILISFLSVTGCSAIALKERIPPPRFYSIHLFF